MLNRNLKTLIGRNMVKPILALSFFVLFGVFVTQTATSASLTSMSNTLSRMKTSTDANHTIQFDLGVATTFGPTDTIVITFPTTSFDLSALSNSAPLDFDIAVNSSDIQIVGNGSCSTNDAIEVTTITATAITFTGCTNLTTTAAGATIEIKIGDHATVGGAGTNQIVNPSSAATYRIGLEAAGDTGELAVAIISDDQVTISASVDSALSVVISSITCNLGQLSMADINTCQYNVTVSTNATNGYNGTILEDGNLRTATNDEIGDATGGEIDAGDEEYGVATSSTHVGNDIATYTTCTNPASDPQVATAITGTAQQFAAADGPISNQATTLCHAASVSGTTPAGEYSHIVTIVVTATY